MPQSAAQREEDAHEQEKPRGRLLARVQVKNVSGAIFENHGSNGPFPVVTFERSYKKGEDAEGKPEYGKAHNYTGTDLDNLVEAANLAKAKMAEIKQEREHSR